MILSGKNKENKSMKKVKSCLTAVVSGVLVATAVLSGCGQSKKWHDIIFKLSVRDSEEHIVSKGFEKNVSKKN